MLLPIDCSQERFFRELGLSEFYTFVHFKLAPLRSRRDMAMLGFIHRSVLGLGPKQFHAFIKPPWRWRTRRCIRQRHRFHLEDPVDGNHLDVFRNSVFGLFKVYNLLDPYIVEANTVASFQGRLQALMLSRAIHDCEDWPRTFCPRFYSYEHPLR